jgi:DNA-binding PadR family transcriptional regulator
MALPGLGGQLKDGNQSTPQNRQFPRAERVSTAIACEDVNVAAVRQSAIIVATLMPRTAPVDSLSITWHDITRYVIMTSDPTLLVLASLADGDKHGYAMIGDIQDFAGVRLGPGTLYGAITRLEESGWIRPMESEDRRRPYRLTAEGRRQLRERLAILEQIVKTGWRRLQQA